MSVFKTALLGGSDFALGDPIHTKWASIGGITAAGPAVSVAAPVTAVSGNAATVQTFDQAMIFNVTSGTLSGRVIAVGRRVFSTYIANGGYRGFLGFSLTDEQVQSNGHVRQSFEGGIIDYDPSGVNPPVVLYPIVNIVVSPAGPLKLNLGDSVILTAAALDANGNALAGRAVTWISSNSSVLGLQPSGMSVTIRAVARGTASITANGEGKASTPVTIMVTAPFCGLGQGAPTAVIQQTFQDAATRNHLNVKLPAAAPVMRSGAGYVQNVVDATTGGPNLLAISDQGSTAYVVSGALLGA